MNALLIGAGPGIAMAHALKQQLGSQWIYSVAFYTSNSPLLSLILMAGFVKI